MKLKENFESSTVADEVDTNSENSEQSRSSDDNFRFKNLKGFSGKNEVYESRIVSNDYSDKSRMSIVKDGSGDGNTSVFYDSGIIKEDFVAAAVNYSLLVLSGKNIKKTHGNQSEVSDEASVGSDESSVSDNGIYEGSAEKISDIIREIYYNEDGPTLQEGETMTSEKANKWIIGKTVEAFEENFLNGSTAGDNKIFDEFIGKLNEEQAENNKEPITKEEFIKSTLKAFLEKPEFEKEKKFSNGYFTNLVDASRTVENQVSNKEKVIREINPTPINVENEGYNGSRNKSHTWIQGVNGIELVVESKSQNYTDILKGIFKDIIDSEFDKTKEKLGFTDKEIDRRDSSFKSWAMSGC